ncbi:glycerol kinase [Paenibacillus sp. BIHB 4019]|uniref:ATP:glycerol 3-phosphotransferase n=1 Tax=Paenibacillus sp. BIHB 4019 TaxID=1870819 RepID=A0A1B2DDF8_9BACL|nr:glycerol kinase GlpK [Paenibacillus sp. BIHB 4019]ANY65735.1 glycerol kinase [Paenibacillus sp. BIHB 4019]
MDKSYLLTIDQSTSGTKALVINRAGEVVSRSAAEHKQYYPQAGWVEHDPLEIYEQVKRTAKEALKAAGIAAGELAALTITNQRETAVMWDKETGEPVHRAIVWQCQRTAERCDALKADGLEPLVQAKTGLLLDPYFSAAKWGWLLEHAAGAKELLAAGRLLVGTIDSWLLWKLTGGDVHATDYTNASRTSLFNIHTLEWDAELCALFGLPPALLPEVKCSDERFGYTNDSDLFAEPVAIAGVVGDSQAALYGQLCLEPGMAKATYGTGTSVLMNVGSKPVASSNGLVLAIAWGLSGKMTYALEAVIRTSGDSMRWVRDNLGLFSSFSELAQLLEETPDNDGVYLVPAFVGLGAPYWKPHARAAITGMSRGTGKAHIVRAALESIAYQVRDAAELMQAETGIALKGLRADGGASDNAVLMQFQADMLGQTVAKSGVAELSAMGSAYMGGVGTGFWANEEQLVQLLGAKESAYRSYAPAMKQEERERLYKGWKQAVASVLHDG